jgi:uncharacterized protein (DUF3820 family)
MNRFIEPAYRGAPARHHVLCFGKYRGRWLSTVPGVYLHFLLKQPTLDPALRRVIFLTLQESADRRFAADEATFKHAVTINGSIPSPKKGRKEKKRA